jgi:predicted RNase H-like nuclease (RuvC/YqgF family)
MNSPTPGFEDIQDRLMNLEKQNRRFKKCGIAVMVLPVFLLGLFSSVVALAQAPTPQNLPSKSAVTADRISVLESKLATLSQKITLLQEEIKILDLEVAHGTSGSREGKADESDLESLKSDVESLKSDVEDKADTSDIDRLKSDLDDKADKPEMDGLQSKLDDLFAFRERFCSAIKFSLAMSGTSTTTSGAGIWNACN